MLELARLTVDSGWIPPRPIIFLFNGAEELFMLVRIIAILVLKLGSLKRLLSVIPNLLWHLLGRFILFYFIFCEFGMLYS